MIDKKYSIGIDIGGTKMSAILYNGEKVIADSKLATPKDSLDNFFVLLKALIEPLLDRAKTDKVKVAGIGVGVAGALNKEKTKMFISPNIPLINGVAIAEKFSQIIDLPVIMDNDAKCFLRAEATIGAGKKYQNIYGLIIGTGIGGALWTGNDIYNGSHGANEPGQMIIDWQSDKWARLEDIYHQLFQNNPAKFAEEAYRGDDLALKKFDEFAQYLGIALANIINVLDPEVIIAGGGVTEVDDLFFKKAEKMMQEFTQSPDAKKTKLIKGKLGQDAGAIGAALLVK